MSSKFVLVVTVNTDGNSVAGAIAPTGVAGNPYTGQGGAWGWVDKVAAFIQEEALGRGVNITYYDTAVSASTTGTFTDQPSNNETITVNGVAFTAKSAAPLGTNGFLIGSTKEATAANLAAAINASTTAGIVGTVGATVSGAVVTFYSLVPGSVGLNTPITESLSNFTVAASTFSTGGTQAHSATISAGV